MGKKSESPEVGQINFGGGVAEQYLGEGQWRIFREDERTCPALRYGKAHEPHEYHYIYTRKIGGVTTGLVYCDGLAEEREPFLLCPLGGSVSS